MRLAYFRLLLAFNFFVIVSTIKAQNLVVNPGFESVNTTTPCSESPFSNNGVSGWLRAAGTPQLAFSGCYQLPHTGTYAARMLYANGGNGFYYPEAIYQNRTFRSCQTYNISFWLKLGSKVVVEVVNNFTPDPEVIGYYTPFTSTIPASDRQVVATAETINNGQTWQLFTFSNVSISKDFQSILFYPNGLDSYIDDISITVSSNNCPCPTPATPTIGIDGNSTYLNCNSTYEAYFTGSSSDIVAYDWNVYPGWTMISSDNGSRVMFQTSSGTSSGWVELRVKNSCGNWSSYGYLNLSSECGGGGHRIFPNPADNFVEVEANLEGSLKDKDFKIKLFDKYGKEKLSAETSSGEKVKKVKLDVRHLAEGLYVINIYVGDAIIRKQLQIKR